MTSTDQELLRLLSKGQFEQFDSACADLCRSVNLEDEGEVRRVAALLEAALLEAKVRRSHLTRDLDELQVARSFFGRNPVSPAIDLLG